MNILVDGAPLTVSWLRPSADVAFKASSFPFYIDTRLSDNVGIASVDITAAAPEVEAEIFIGTLKSPKSNGVSVTWDTPPGPGKYTLASTVHLMNGETIHFNGPVVTVK